jgi:hypothetical protein
MGQAGPFFSADEADDATKKNSLTPFRAPGNPGILYI